MPDFGDDLSDAQIANVLNYVRTHFGNHFKDTITPANIAAARRPKAAGP
jgi:mono/diheme cytochrome c family protein